MCRLARITSSWPGLLDYLRQLQRSCGGDGNGLAYQHLFLKGLKLSNKRIAELIQEKPEGAPALYHTRMASVGDRCSNLCHPFHCHKGWLVHNGTWCEGAKHARLLTKQTGQQFSDTAVMAMLIETTSFACAMKKYDPWGVWLWQSYDGELFVHKHWGSLCYSPSLDAWGSEAPIGPDGLDWYDVKDGDYLPGETPAVKEPYVWTMPCVATPTVKKWTPGNSSWTKQGTGFWVKKDTETDGGDVDLFDRGIAEDEKGFHDKPDDWYSLSREWDSHHGYHV
jgi:hypothetical protein